MSMSEETLSEEPLSVSGALALAKGALESLTVRLVGEVSEVSIKPGYKAAYFTVKDSSAALPCMMWNNRYFAAGIELRVGMLVELTGRFSLYAPKGRMNFDVFSISLAGEGNLRQQVANRARLLQAEGLMNPARKRPLPELPQVIGIVTSPRGAVIHDMLRTLRRRFPLVQVLVAGVPVEGVSAAQALIAGLETVADAGAEVILLGRGGGSFEDLMPFNDEALARAIANSPVPVVTGIGHEPDTTIADMVADRRASTPTAAAEAVVPDKSTVLAELDLRASVLKRTLLQRLHAEDAKLEALATRPVLSDAQSLFSDTALTLDVAYDRLQRTAQRFSEEHRIKLQYCFGRLQSALPAGMEKQHQSLSRLEEKLVDHTQNMLKRFESNFELATAQLESLSPLAILSRGYAVAQGSNGRILKSARDVSVGDDITVMLDDGRLTCLVNGLESKEAISSLERS